MNHHPTSPILAMNGNGESVNKVNIAIDIQYTTNIIDYLLSQNIPFLVHFQTLTSLEIPQQIVRPDTSIPKKHSRERDKLEMEDKDENIFEQYLKKCLTIPIPNAEEISRELGVSYGTFRRYFQQTYGMTFYQVCLQQKMEYAAKLLKKGYKSNEVSEMIGYGKTSAIKFNKMFQKHFGITPKKYQMERYGKIDRR